MKEYNVIFDVNGRHVSFNESFAVAGDDNTVIVKAVFPDEYNTYTKRNALVVSSGGSSGILPLIDNAVTLTKEFLFAGTTSVTFELTKADDTACVRFQKINISVSPAVNPTGDNQYNTYMLTFSVDSVETGEPGTEASVENVGTDRDVKLKFVIPKGDKGETGETGHTGPQGAIFTPNIDDNGNISWSNNGGLKNPQTKNIKGPKGDAFTYEDFTDEQLASLNGGMVTPAVLFYYDDNGDGTCRIRKFIGSDTNVVIPYKINGLKVVNIYVDAFSGRTNITSVIIPDGVTNIESRAFRDCTNIITITIPDSVTYINSDAFTGLPNITIICNQGSYAEDYAKRFGIAYKYNVVEPLELANNLTTEEAGKALDARQGKVLDDKISNLSINVSGVQSMASQNGLEITSLKGKTLNNQKAIGGLQTQANQASSDISNHESRINENTSAINGLKYYGDANIVPTDASAFAYSDNGDGTCTITGFNHSGITDVVIPYEIDGLTVTKLGAKAFYGNAYVTEIIVPNSIKQVGVYSFSNCAKLNKLTFSDGQRILLGGWMIENTPNLKTVTLSNGVDRTGQHTFVNSSLKSLILPESVQIIDDYSFSQCEDLEYIYIPDRVTEISKTAFNGCDNVVIYCNAGSYAEQYAIENGIAYKSKAIYVDDVIAALPIYDGEVVEV